MLEGCTRALGRSLCQQLEALVSSAWSPGFAASRPVLNFDQSQTYLRSAVWNPLGTAVCAEADCDIGNSTALCFAAAASDRAGSLDSNGMIISPSWCSAFFCDYAQQWNSTSFLGRCSLRVCSLSYACISALPCLSLPCCLSSLWSLCPPSSSPSPLHRVLAKSRPLHWGRFSQAPQRLFYQDSH